MQKVRCGRDIWCLNPIYGQFRSKIVIFSFYRSFCFGFYPTLFRALVDINKNIYAKSGIKKTRYHRYIWCLRTIFGRFRPKMGHCSCAPPFRFGFFPNLVWVQLYIVELSIIFTWRCSKNNFCSSHFPKSRNLTSYESRDNGDLKWTVIISIWDLLYPSLYLTSKRAWWVLNFG